MIEVGDFVRANGIIGKVEQIGNSLFWLEDGSSYSLSDKTIRHSKIISEVVEVGDYVNGKEVYIQDGKLAVELAEHIPPYELLENIDIETILTKEQYESNCYTVERKE